jgi:hypothetical protein
MKYLVRVRVNTATMAEFGEKLQKGELDRNCIRGETYCLQNDPAVGMSIWEAESDIDFEAIFNSWKPYYEEIEIQKVISPMEAMKSLLSRNPK